MNALPTLNLGAITLRRAIFARLQRGPHSAVSLAALIEADLKLVTAVLDRLVVEGRVVRDGVLYRFPMLAA